MMPPSLFQSSPRSFALEFLLSSNVILLIIIVIIIIVIIIFNFKVLRAVFLKNSYDKSRQKRQKDNKMIHKDSFCNYFSKNSIKFERSWNIEKSESTKSKITADYKS